MDLGGPLNSLAAQRAYADAHVEIPMVFVNFLLAQGVTKHDPGDSNALLCRPVTTTWSCAACKKSNEI